MRTQSRQCWDMPKPLIGFFFKQNWIEANTVVESLLRFLSSVGMEVQFQWWMIQVQTFQQSGRRRFLSASVLYPPLASSTTQLTAQWTPRASRGTTSVRRRSSAQCCGSCRGLNMNNNSGEILQEEIIPSTNVIRDVSHWTYVALLLLLLFTSVLLHGFCFTLASALGAKKLLNLISCSTLKLCDLIDNRAALINESSCSFVFVVLLIYQMLYAFNFLFASTWSVWKSSKMLKQFLDSYKLDLQRKIWPFCIAICGNHMFTLKPEWWNDREHSLRCNVWYHKTCFDRSHRDNFGAF